MRVDFDDAVRMVAEYSSADEFPEISQAALEQIVHRCARVDSHGRLPDNPIWDETYDVYAATATVFEVKAARVANRFDFSTDGQALNRSQMAAHFMAMAKMWRARTAGVISKQPPESDSIFSDYDYD
jgi:hypothetical protein